MLRTVALGLLLVIPMAAAQVQYVRNVQADPQGLTVSPAIVDTALYFHPIGMQDMPLNTQLPPYDPALASDRFGTTWVTLTCLHPTTGDVAGSGVGTDGLTSQALHTFQAYASTLVEYDQKTQNGNPRVHPERGLSYDIPLDRSVRPVLQWFLMEHNGAGVDGVERAALANVQVRVDVLTELPDGDLIMQGATLPVTAFAGQVTGDGADQVTASQVGERWVYGFAVPLETMVENLSQEMGFEVRTEVLVDNPVCGSGSVMTPTVDVAADLEHRPRIEFRHAQPLRIEYAAAAQTASGTIDLHWSVGSGWGNYDVAAEETDVDLVGPTEVVPTLSYSVQRSREHYHVHEPVDQGWTLDGNDLADGRYTAIFTVPNLQHTATATAEVSFLVHDGKMVEQVPDEAPGIGFAILAGLLAVVAMLRRGA